MSCVQHQLLWWSNQDKGHESSCASLTLILFHNTPQPNIYTMFCIQNYSITFPLLKSLFPHMHTYQGSTCSRWRICIWRACLRFWPSGDPLNPQCHIYTAGPAPVCWAPWGQRWPTRPGEASLSSNLASREPVYHMMLTDSFITVLVLVPSEKQEDIERETNEWTKDPFMSNRAVT